MSSLTDDEIQELAGFIRDLRDPDECCHGLLITRKWLAARYGRVDPSTLGWLRSQQAACDCEVANYLARIIRHE